MKNLFRIVALLLLACTISFAELHAQGKKKPITKAIIGKWQINDIEIKLDESKATEEQKQQFEAMLPAMKAQVEKIKADGKSGYFIFKGNGTYITRSPNATKDAQGTWTAKDETIRIKSDSDKDKFTGTIENNMLYLSGMPEDSMPMPMTMRMVFKKQ